MTQHSRTETATKTAPVLSSVAPVDETRSRSAILEQQLQHSLSLEASMLELQREFMQKSERISRHISRLGVQLGLNRAA